GDWFNIAHPMPLRFLLAAIGWLPEELAPNRENHIIRSSAVVNFLSYQVGRIEYTTFDAPPESVEVLRLAFEPRKITGDDRPLRRRRELDANGYTIKRLTNGDCIVAIRHDGSRRVVVSGPDPQRQIPSAKLEAGTGWRRERTLSRCGSDPQTSSTHGLVADRAGESVTARFE